MTTSTSKTILRHTGEVQRRAVSTILRARRFYGQIQCPFDCELIKECLTLFDEKPFTEYAFLVEKGHPSYMLQVPYPINDNKRFSSRYGPRFLDDE